MTRRPPYRIPAMSEIRATPHNGRRVVSLFAGGGGSSTGYRIAGYRVVFANEFVPAAAETYAANADPTTVVDTTDVRELTGGQISARAGFGVGDLDVLDGSPPCASFSTAGRGPEHWGEVRSYSDTTQRVDDLFWEFTRLLGELQPRTFVAENVTGLVRGASKGHFKRIYSALGEAGYQVAARVLDASRLGVPQARRRLVLIGVRADIGLPPVHPDPLPYAYPVRDAFRDLPPGPISHDPETGRDIRVGRYAIGEDWRRLRAGEAARYQSSALARPGAPCPTVTATTGNVGAAGVMHAEEPRKLTLPELRAVCSFPADYVLTGTYEQRVERLGRSVPPLMMYAVATRLLDVLDRRAAA